jgi:hypothetical protein
MVPGWDYRLADSRQRSSGRPAVADRRLPWRRITVCEQFAAAGDPADDRESDDVDTTAPTRMRHRRRPIVGLALAIAAIGTIGAASFSLALFTSTATVAGNAFTTGTIVLGVSPVSTIFTSASMMPGDSAPTGVPGAAVTISNTGTGALRYAIAGTSTDADGLHLNTQLLITVKQPDGNAGSSCTLMSGTTLFSAVVPTAGVNIVGDPTPGFQAGDRPLTAGTSETLCFKASLPIGTLNPYQGAASTYTFTFSAEQTANNP